MVVDVPTATILARVGSADFGDTQTAGQVDGCRSTRSPGSALKPFLYALAMERNCLYAGEMLLDTSLDYGLYSPEDFDRRQRGLVSAAEALRLSLNIPAVTLLERVGVHSNLQFLRGLGLSSVFRSPAEYGVGLVLGNCEVSLEEMASAYCMLARLGESRPLAALADPTDAMSRRCLSRGTCLKLYEMLEQALPGETESEGGQTLSVVPRVCWKTGTSTGQHDAWAFVFNMHYLVGVWVGNPDGRPSRRLVGVETALPLAGRIFRSLKPRNIPAWPEPGDDLREVAVCAASGLPASLWCRETRRTWLPRAQYTNRICDVHHPGPSAAESQVSTVVERWPASARGWNLARVRLGDLPVVQRPGSMQPPMQQFRILAPTNHAEYILTEEPDADRIVLHSTADETTVYWYLDDRFLGHSAPQTPLTLELKPGCHKLVCMTAEGVSDQVTFEVLLPAAAMRFKN
jgi:penicillin-binding protein 1C